METHMGESFSLRDIMRKMEARFGSKNYQRLVELSSSRLLSNRGNCWKTGRIECLP
ncbi:hypothetical protein DPMN_146166 [Dreissena polymorpha]|uniref:Uncharacterized protein n=1 Tax=Dreissena polymorpha TaxID=45954 RepID=A0A9D4J224_DREPO|nr:hypothetical protein DPMN_146166 [Dreissena polymorpha]